ncbi:penicillin-binding protein activator [Afifella pfennigii]|uniref:penicillin-binding protein activator n=1 Tax=Afifella pfennigii TaxID=209897 RepID=UPI000691EE2A|nr:penicillin-binding protein activator [Afifella pfennigii]
MRHERQGAGAVAARFYARIGGVIAALAMVFALAACTSFSPGGFGTVAPPPAADQGRVATGEVIGQGSTRVAMLLPLSATGNAGNVGRAFRNAAEMAMRDFPSAGIQLVIYDTAGTPSGAQLAANKAIAEGGQIVLGPLFSNSVGAVAPIARQAGAPVVAFSSDTAVAGPGVYLLSFLPNSDIERIVSYASAQNRKAFAALLPNDAYGTVADAAFRQAVASAGGRVMAIERYERNDADIRAKVAAIAAIAPRIDALLVPEGGQIPGAVARGLGAAGAQIKLLGSGQWDDPAVTNDRAVAGGWFPAPTKKGFQGFASRYASAYGGPPPRNATLAYDATVLAAGLVRQNPGNAFSTTLLTNANGFSGLDGVFRLRSDGTNQRQLAVFEVTGSGAREIEAAPRSFSGGGGF